MRVNARESGDCMILELEGRLVTGTGAEQLNQAINKVLGEGRRKIVIDLSAVTRIDSSGLGELVAGVQLAQRFDSAIRFVKPERRVHKVLKIAQVLPALKMYGSEAEAIASF